jgi:hypothetical protein
VHRYGVPSPAADLTHFQVDLGVFRLRWEHRPNCSSYTFFRHGDFETPFADPVIRSVPQDWLEKLPGTVLVAAHMALRGAAGQARRRRAGPAVRGQPGQRLAGGRRRRQRGDGFPHPRRWLQPHPDRRHPLAPGQAGRTVLRLFEIETYLMRASRPLRWPARPCRCWWMPTPSWPPSSPRWPRCSKDEPALLDRLTRLAATVEGTISATLYRICTARAHQELVTRRIAELREQRVEACRPCGSSSSGACSRR